MNPVRGPADCVQDGHRRPGAALAPMRTLGFLKIFGVSALVMRHPCQAALRDLVRNAANDDGPNGELRLLLAVFMATPITVALLVLGWLCARVGLV